MVPPEKAAPPWVCVTLPDVPLFGVVPIRSTHIHSHGPTTCSRILLLWQWVFLKVIWPKMAEGFKAIRKAELELAGEYNPAEHDEFFTYFNWQQFTDEEWLLCPPVVALGGDGAMYDIGFQNLSRLMASGKPIKVIIVDTQVYSNTGGQACTSGFIGQVSDMAQYGKVWKGKPEPRKEIGLIAMAHRNTYVLQGTLANTSQMIEGFIDGLMAKRLRCSTCIPLVSPNMA
jgi:hypothetical protein